ncbi:MAG: hypothetical protein HC902_00760 [Calothrix sp. SM1_5_4]|nr:hypothetical protein [Calothrix sp. SM1_5_4]
MVGALNYGQMTDFKKQLGSVREIKALRERLFESSRVTFEAETAVNGQELAKAVQRHRFSAFAVSVSGSQDNGLVLNVRPLSSASAH